MYLFSAYYAFIVATTLLHLLPFYSHTQTTTINHFTGAAHDSTIDVTSMPTSTPEKVIQQAENCRLDTGNHSRHSVVNETNTPEHIINQRTPSHADIRDQKTPYMDAMSP